MKNKFLSTALILGALYGTANATSITSPIYMPEQGKISTDLKIGFTKSKFDKRPAGESDKLEESWNLDAEGKMGLTDEIALNYGFNFDFARKIRNGDKSAKFTDFYLGLTGRVVNTEDNKFDIILNVGQEEDTIISLQDQVYAELAVRYGLDLDMYNLGLSVGGKYINDYEDKDGDGITSYKIERDYLVSFKLENEFIFDEFTVGLDLFYNINGDIKEKTDGITTAKFGSYNEYGFNVDANYALTEDNNYVGLYFAMAQSDIKGPKDSAEQYKEPTEYKFGLKFVSEF